MVDYSKWDKMQFDSDSEAEELAASVPPAFRAPPPAPPSTSSSATPTTSNSNNNNSTPGGPVRGITIHCEIDKKRNRGTFFPKTDIPTDHEIFSKTAAPISTLIDLPLVFHRLNTQSAGGLGDLDNQIATYLNIDAQSGFAPPAWQSDVGSVLVARKDKKPLLPHHLEGFWMYCDRILDFFGEGSAPRHMYSKKAFEGWWERYVREQQQFRPGRGGEEDVDDWRSVRSPYEM